MFCFSLLAMKRTTHDWEAHIGRQLRRARLDADLTQAEVASRCGVSALTIAKLESGAGSRLSTLIKAMKALGLEGQLDTLVPPAPISPIQVKREGKLRERASARRK